MLLADRCMGKAEGLVTLPIHSASPDLVLVLEEGVLMDLLLPDDFILLLLRDFELPYVDRGWNLSNRKIKSS